MVKNQTNILIVDDQQNNLLSMEVVLAPLGQNILMAKSGEEALNLILDNEIAVILMDVKMPGMDGFEVASIIRSRDKSKYIPIIFLTAHDQNTETTLKAYKLGAVDFIYKPIIIQEIIRSKVSVFVKLHEAKLIERELENEQRQVLELRTALEYINKDNDTSLSIGEKMFGISPLSERHKELFTKFVDIYTEVLHTSLKSRILKIEHKIPVQLRELAEEMGFLRARPRDIIELHTRSLTAITTNKPPQKTQAFVVEGRLRVLELMGYLAFFYRKYYTGGVQIPRTTTKEHIAVTSEPEEN